MDTVEKICAKCAKPIINGARYSVTSWIFRGNRCLCSSKDLPHTRQTEDRQSGAEFYDKLVEELEGYRFEEKIGEGGMGVVFKVWNEKLDKHFALKVLKKELAADKEAKARFEQETALARELDHPNLVAVYDHGTTGRDCPYIIMDFVEGESLERLLKREHCLDSLRATAIFSQICEAVAYAHEKGVLHRDLKPSNILIRTAATGDSVKVVDFGIAKILPQVNRETLNLTRTGEIFGSPYYMSPEQCMGEEIGTRSDIYSLGCLMYEVLTGNPPFKGDNPIKTIMHHLTKAPKPCGLISSDYSIPADLEGLVMQCLEKAGESRPATMKELLKRLERINNQIDTRKEPLSASVAYFYRRRLILACCYLTMTAAIGFALIKGSPVIAVAPLLISMWIAFCSYSQAIWIKKANHIIKSSEPEEMEVYLSRKYSIYRVYFSRQTRGGKTKEQSLLLHFRNGVVPDDVLGLFDERPVKLKAYKDENGLPVAFITGNCLSIPSKGPFNLPLGYRQIGSRCTSTRILPVTEEGNLDAHS